MIFQHDGGIKSLKIFSVSEDLTETLVWDLTDRTQESNEQWEVGQTFFLGQQVILSVRWQPGQEISNR